LGNLSNPCLNRWGFNIFWTKFWYSDKFYAQNLQHDVFFEKLIYTYLTYGILLTKKNLTSLFWFPVKANTSVTETNLYYRWYTRLSNLHEHSGFYKIRTSLTGIYYMRFWVFKFMNWTVINVYWFRSIKPTKVTSLRHDKPLNQFYVLENKNKTILKRLKFFMSKNVIRFLDKKLFYKF